MDNDKNLEMLPIESRGELSALDQAAVERIWGAVEPSLPRKRSVIRSLAWPGSVAAALAAGVIIGLAIGAHGATTAAAVAEVSSAVEQDEAFFREAATLLRPLAVGDGVPLTLAMQVNARDLLASTRLALDAGATDPVLRGLLEDLELVLAQMIPLSGPADEADARYVSQALVARDVVPRLTSAIATARGGD